MPSGKSLELGVSVPHLEIRTPVCQSEHRKRKDARCRAQGPRQSPNVHCHSSGCVSEGSSWFLGPEAFSTPFGLSFQVGAPASLSLAAHHSSNSFSEETNVLPGFGHLAQHSPFPRQELLPPPTATWSGRSLCLQTSRDGELTTSKRQSQHLLIPWVPALYSSISRVLKQGTETSKGAPACQQGDWQS